MAEDGSHPPEISISRTSSVSSKAKKSSPPNIDGAREDKQTPKVYTHNAWNPHFSSWTPKSHKSWDTRHDIEWHIKWTENCFPNGRVLIIDYISNTATSPASGKRHVAVAAQEFQDIESLRKFYSDNKRIHSAALRVIHVQNATWATGFLLRKFNIDHRSEIVGMQGFSKWARYEKPRQRNGKPFPNGRSWREQTDPWRNVSRTAFGLDYLKVYPTPAPNRRQQQGVFGLKPIDAQMMHLNSYEDGSNPDGYDVSVQRMSFYVQRNLGPTQQISPDQDVKNVKNPYMKHKPNGHFEKEDEWKIDLDALDNSNTVILFETSASMLMEDCLVQPRNDFEKRWRRLSFYLRKEDVTNDTRLAAQCTNIILGDVFHGLGVIWQDFLSVSADHVNILEDKIYENPADESRAPELWTNQAAWLKVDKIMYIHQDLIKEMQGHMRDLADVDVDDEPHLQTDWIASIPAEYERLAHSVSEDLVQPTANLSDLMYKSVGIRDSRQSLQLGLSMWRLSWITFIFLPLTFIVSFFGMNVGLFEADSSGHLPSVGWYFLAAGILMIFVLVLWYCVKHSLQRRRQTPFQRGVYEHLFEELEDGYPNMWTARGASDAVEPVGYINTVKWHLLQRWFAPEKTIDKKLYSSLGTSADDADLGSWDRFKRYLLLRWLPTIKLRHRAGDAISIAEIASTTDDERGGRNSAPASLLHYQPGTINELAKMSTPVAMADAEPVAVQQISTYGLRPLSLTERRTSSGSVRRHSDERPSSRGSSGIMIEERNLSDSESDAGEGAADQFRRRGSDTEPKND